MSNYNEALQGNNAALEEILREVRELPDGLLGSRLSLGYHTDGLIYIFVDGKPAGVGIEISGGGIPGYIDSENNIIISNLPEGDYTIRYEMEDGSAVDIGALTLGATGPTNLADPTSADWLTDHRLSTSGGGGSALEGHILTNYIPAKMGDVLRVKGLDITAYVNSKHCAIGAYKADKTFQAVFVYTGAGGTSSTDGAKDKVTVSGDVQTYTILMDDSGTQRATAETAYIRIDGVPAAGYTANDVIITINEEIV